MATSSESFEKLLKKTRTHPTPKRIHRLRVLTRKLRVPLQIADLEQQDQRIQKVRRQIKRLGRLLGERRKWDVAIEDARQFQLDTEELERQCKRAQKKLNKELKRDFPRKLARIEKRALKENSASLLKETADRLRPYLKGIPRRAKARHEMRIELKKTRYLLEFYGVACPLLACAQDHLGREHDLEVLIHSHPSTALRREKGKHRQQADEAVTPAVEFALAELHRLTPSPRVPPRPRPASAPLN